jgi:hypothetical protein
MGVEGAGRPCVSGEFDCDDEPDETAKKPVIPGQPPQEIGPIGRIRRSVGSDAAAGIAAG